VIVALSNSSGVVWMKPNFSDQIPDLGRGGMTIQRYMYIAVFLLYVYCVRRSHLASVVKHFLLHPQLSAFFYQHCHGHKFQTPKYNCHICCGESDLVEKNIQFNKNK